MASKNFPILKFLNSLLFEDLNYKICIKILGDEWTIRWVNVKYLWAN